MAWVQHTQLFFTALSTDSKITVGVISGANLLELDTDQQYIFDGTAWSRFENVAIPWVHKRGHLGKMWNFSNLYIDIANDANADLVVEVGDDSLHTLFRESAEGAVWVYIYEAPTVTDATGTAATVKNQNRIIGDAGGPTVLVNPTIEDTGTLLMSWYNSGGTGGNAQGGGAEFDTELILAPATKYLFRMTNKKGNAAELSWMLHSYTF